MGTVSIQEFTTKNPISRIGYEAGVCWGADVSDPVKNYQRGIDCIEKDHGRTLEFPDVYATIEGYSARVIREWYTHIGGAPTRLQASTRYINYNEFEYVVPPLVEHNPEAKKIYEELMSNISDTCIKLKSLGVPTEDVGMVLPLAMTTKIVDKRNSRNLIDMSRQRECSRAYHEYRELFADYKNALRNYSEEWAYLVDRYFMPKCEYRGFCPENNSKCKRMPNKNELKEVNK